MRRGMVMAGGGLSLVWRFSLVFALKPFFLCDRHGDDGDDLRRV
jgi:hypothetical protein